MSQTNDNYELCMHDFKFSVKTSRLDIKESFVPTQKEAETIIEW